MSIPSSEEGRIIKKQKGIKSLSTNDNRKQSNSTRLKKEEKEKGRSHTSTRPSHKDVLAHGIIPSLTNTHCHILRMSVC